VDFKRQSTPPQKIGRIPHLVGAKIGQKLEIVYHIHLIEKTGFIEDLFCKTKALRAFQGGQIRGVAYTLLKIQLLIVIFSFGGHDF